MKITEITQGHLPATPENIAKAKAFLLQKWQERATERGRAQIPDDLSDACKFVSLFAQRVFGGKIRGNWHHQYLFLPGNQILDLTEPSRELAQLRANQVDPYQHDRQFFGNRVHRDSMASCEPRVTAWVQEFLGGPNA